MRFGYALLLAGLLETGACTDGVGMPIREALENEDGGAGGARDADWSCADVVDWQPDIAASEAELLRLINEHRTNRFQCGDRVYEPRGRLLFASALRCSARLHSRDLATNPDAARGIFGSDRSDPPTRMEAAGFEPDNSGELIADDEPSAEDAFRDLFVNDDNINPCRMYTDDEYTHIGVGRYHGWWTVDFAEEQGQDGAAGP